MVDPSSAPKRYTPPNLRNRSSNRRRSRGSFHSNEGDRNQPVAAGLRSEKSSPRIISLQGCSKSEAFELLSDRWAAAMHLYNDPTVDLSERPVLYYGGDILDKLPHQMKPTLASANTTLPQAMLPADYRID